jgi:hypothetical protein
VGDAVTRVVTIKAERAPSMLLPPTIFSAIDGPAVYPAQPSLQDKTEGRNEELSATRVDSATYMLERAGDYELPAVDVRWWNGNEGKVETAHLDAVKLQVVPNPARASAVGTSARSWNWRELADFVADHRMSLLLAVVVLAVVAWFAPRLAKEIALRHRRRRAAWLGSEAYFFGRLRRAARSGDATTTYFALLQWLQRFEPGAPLQTLTSFAAAARDSDLDREIDALQSTLFAPPQAMAVWSPRRLMRRLGAARRRLQRQARRSEPAHVLPQRLNPIQDPVPSRRLWRAPAR